jgi:hypothetical protein
LKKWRVVCFGLGPIGRSIAKLAFSRKDSIEIVGAIDADPSLIGKDLADLIGSDASTGIKVSSRLGESDRNADIVLHATSSFLSVAEAQLREICYHGLDVVSTNEELAHPWYNHREAAERLDSAAKRNGVSLLATGVNPGFVLDVLAITLSGVCAKVSEVRATRILDATKRRIPFQKKVGIGLTPKEFEANVRTGKFGHIGLPESIAMVCDSLGRPVDKIEQTVSAKIASTSLETEHFGVVNPGNVIGLVQDGTGYSGERKIAKYHIEMYAGAADPYDEIELVGEPTIKLRILGGTPGDIATAAIIVNSIPRVIDAPPGLLTVKDLRPASSVMP